METVRARRWQLAPFELWISIVAIYAGLSHFFLPPTGNSALIARAFPWVVTVWSVLYALGGFLILVGLVKHSPAIEGCGLCLLGSGIAVTFTATLYVGHSPVLSAIIGQLLGAAACGVRLQALWKFSK